MQGRELAPPGLAQLADRALGFIASARAESTRRAYRSDWDAFASWCGGRGLSALPAAPGTVALYLAALATTHKPGSLRRRLTAIGKAHEAAGYESPASTRHAVVGETLKGIRRTLGTAQAGKRPLLTKEIRTMVEALPENLQGARDRVLLLMGFAGGFRRSELAALDVEDVTLCEEGLIVRLRRSKTDQEGQGRLVALPYGSNPATCPVRAWRKWREQSGIQEGALFRGIDRHGALAAGPRGHPLHKDSIGLIVKRAVQRIGLAPAGYAGHSLRAGLATEAYRNGATEFAIMQQTGHRSAATLRRYIREGSLFRDNAAAKLGL